ncbi:unnamed protein product [Rotaria socialis]|uniref:Uncharacterized protein n=1 Tax=Rotaria socialis TaxID=392032 RepID=A0A820NJX8_9BILA|nr:unnamed protein product [Rotaria socialis]CAF4388045.1 unnamed protein product [Rotaria socialis]
MTLMKSLLLINIIFISQTIEDQLSENVKLNVADSWCCKIEPPIETISQTRQITYYVLRHERHKCGYYGCGVLNLGRCTKWCSETWTEAVDGVENYLVNKTLPCPKNQRQCCPNHIFIMGHCLSFAEVHDNQNLLMELNELNIVMSGPIDI